jgi:hypothetical protein
MRKEVSKTVRLEGYSVGITDEKDLGSILLSGLR